MAVTEKIIEETIERFTRLEGDRLYINRVWEELAELLAPERRGFIGQVRSQRADRQFDTVPVVAKRGLVNSIGAMLRPKTSAPGRWYDIVTEDENLMDDPEVKSWIEHAEKKLWNGIYNPKAHFVQATGEVDDDVVTFGTAAMFTTRRRDLKGLLFRAFHMKSVYIAFDAGGDVDTTYIRERISAREAAQKYGRQNLGAKVLESLDSKAGATPDTKHRFIWTLKPRHDRDPRMAETQLGMPIESTVIDVDSEKLVLEEGFEEMPISIPQWDKRSDQLYSRSPGLMALPDLESLNKMGKTMLRGLHRAVAPPWLLPSDSMVSAPNLNADRVSYYDARAIRNLGLTTPFQQMETKGRLDWGLTAQDAIREQIHALFYRNILKLPVAGPEMTATEIIARKEQFIREIGSVFGQLETSYTAPMVERAFNLMQRNNGFRPPPDILIKANVNFRFASPIEKAKRQIEETQIAEGIRTILEVGSIRPEVMDRVNWDAWAKNVAETSDFPPSLLQDDATIEQIQRGRQQAQEQEQNAQGVERMAGVAKDVAKAGPELQEALTGQGGA
jgi:hypothetical protein